MIRTPGESGFFIRYFPTFMGTVLLNIFSASLTVSLAGSTYFKQVDGALKANYSIKAILLMTVLLVLGNFMIVRGRTWGVWLVAVFFIVCLLMVLPMFLYNPHKVIFTLAVLFPLLGLLLLNSQRHREMRVWLSEFRQRRISMIQARKHH